MKRLNLLLTIMVMVIFTSTTFAQGVVRGVVQDVNTDETLIGATVMIEGTTIGVTTNLDGSFLLIVPSGDHKLSVSFVGYETTVMDISVKDGSTYNLGTILVKSNAIGLDEVNVLASVAIDRKTPVAVSTIDAQTIENNLGSQEFPEIMKTTPNVYVTKQGGGFGDARMNVRGFNQRNVAVMINGIPVNDMENGWVYWSNWAGLGDATRTIQVQRGLGASKLAINSVGGTVNIITKTTDMNKGGSLKMEATDFGRFKTTLALSTGKLKSGTAVTFVGSRTFGTGYIDATWADAWSYFLSVSQDVGKDHQLVLTVIGAPQQHGQRDGYYMLDSAKYEKYGTKYTQNWGYRGGEVLNERVNYYHKPQMALNWYWTINEKAFLATSAYLSFGNGGGSGPLGYGSYLNGNQYSGYYKYEPPQTASGQYDWDQMADINANEDMYSVRDGDTTWVPAGESKHIIRNSVNNHLWMGVLSTLTYNLSDNLVLTAGLDSRYYEGEHYREVRDLIGGDYWSDKAFGQTKVGDKIAYWNDGIVTYGGIFTQLEYSKGNFDAFVTGTVSNTWTARIDYYNYTPGTGEKSETLSNMGYNAKIGANYNLNEKNNIFVNAGYYSRVPFFRFMFLNYRNDVNPDLQNESIMAAELGYGFKSKKFSAQFNAYYSVWDDISVLTSFQADNGANVNVFMSDLKEVHTGIELNANYAATRWLGIGGLLTIGDWTYANDPEAQLFDDESLEPIGTGTLYTKDLKVPNQPQTMAGLFLNIQATKSIDFGLNYLYYADIYADFTPEDRDTEADRAQSWKLPNYGTTDFRFGWRFQVAGLDSYFNMNIYNLFNVEALVEAEDKQVKIENAAGDVIGYEHTFKKGFWNWGRNFNFALKVNF
ncbi:MAG: TonB-dependent receptor [Bacteroidales bacterium]|nr:TonB-dependent receptor [Bacteroidales bacterium]MDG2081833.1 TonB-dependent receptor [Bacteroidales bacterium]